MSHPIEVDTHHVPDAVKEWDYWVLWDFELKQPRAPWTNDHCFPSEWRQDGDVNPRTSYDQAKAAADLGPKQLDDFYGFPEEPPEAVGPTLLLPHEGLETPGPEPANPPLLFIDYDDVVNKSDNSVPSEVWDVIEEIGGPTFVSRSYGDSGKEVAGLHQLARGTLPGTMTCLPSSEFDSRGHVEVYQKSRMTGFTWQHVADTPRTGLPDASQAIADLVDEYGSQSARRRASSEPTAGGESGSLEDVTPPEELADMDVTSDIEDVFSAIKHVRASDIRLRSELTEERAGGRKSYNPSWETSKSGTRLGYDDIGGSESWIYRDGNEPVDALQVVAAEERITRDIATYPEGEDFWKAVQRLRERGASIPLFKGESGLHPDYLRLYEDAESDEDKRRVALRAMRASNRG